MFQYTHELIFNSLTMPDGSDRLVRNGGNKGPLTVKRGGEYWGKFIQNQTVYKTEGHVGKYEILTLDVSALGQIFPGQDGAFMVPGTYQLNMFVKLLDPHALYEFGYPNWNTFGRQLLIGFDVTASDTAATVAEKIYDSYVMAVRKEEFLVGGDVENEALKEFVPGTDTKVSLRANHFALRFDAMGVAIYDETTCNSCIGEYLPVIDILNNVDTSKNAAEVTVNGVEPFATGEWLVENLRFPTYPNIRYYAVGAADRPVPGTVYVQYSFAYESPRPQLGGLSGVGQAMYAVTRHVYYVPKDLASAFEAAFTGIGCEIVSTDGIEVTDVDANTAFTPGGAPIAPASNSEGSSESGSEGSSTTEGGSESNSTTEPDTTEPSTTDTENNG